MKANSNYTPRPATEDDLSKVVAIEKASINPPWSENDFREELEKEYNHFWVLTDDETDEDVIAYIIFAFIDRQAHILTFAVRPELRRKHIGQKLFEYVLNYVMRREAASMFLEVRSSNESAIKFYQKQGFIVLEKREAFYSDGESAYRMVKKVLS